MRVLTILSLLFVAITFGLTLAHALEWPGKRRLDEAAYRTVQQIYYPGFTLGGLAEVAGVIALAVLLYLTPFAGSGFWWTAAAFVLLAGAVSVYWLMTHPVNRFWVKDIAMTAPGKGFFATFAGGKAGDWMEMRNIWELSHAIRAGLATLSLISIAIATSHFEGEG